MGQGWNEGGGGRERKWETFAILSTTNIMAGIQREKRNRVWPPNSTTVLEHCCCESSTAGLRVPGGKCAYSARQLQSVLLLYAQLGNKVFRASASTGETQSSRELQLRAGL